MGHAVAYTGKNHGKISGKFSYVFSQNGRIIRPLGKKMRTFWEKYNNFPTFSHDFSQCEKVEYD